MPTFHHFPNTRVLFSSRIAAATITAGFAIASLNEGHAQVSYSTPGSTYSQNFDSLPNAPTNFDIQPGLVWSDNIGSPAPSQVSLLGWYLYHPKTLAEGGANGNQRLRIGAGTATTGAFMSFGAAASTERALGDIGSNNLSDPAGPGPADIYIGLRLSNNTGQTLDSFTLSYNGEQWRDGGAAAPAAQNMTFMWSTTATAISDPNTLFTTAATLSYSSPVFANTGTGAAVDGNSAGLVAVGPVTVTGLNWLPGTDLWLRWDDINNAGSDHGLAVDNLGFSAIAAVPEPSTWALFTIGALALLRFRHRKN